MISEAVAAVSERFRVGINAAEGINDANVSLDVGRRAEMVGRRTDTDGDAVGAAD